MLAVAESLQLDVDEVKRRRLALGLTMEQAADAGGFGGGRQQWYHIESGQRADVPISTLGKLGKALKCKPAVLLK